MRGCQRYLPPQLCLRSLPNFDCMGGACCATERPNVRGDAVGVDECVIAGRNIKKASNFTCIIDVVADVPWWTHKAARADYGVFVDETLTVPADGGRSRDLSGIVNRMRLA